MAETDTSEQWPAGEFSEGHPDAVEDYEPHFDRMGTTRRVLAFITDEEHLGTVRNTPEALAQELNDDPYTNYDGDPEELQEYLDKLVEAGLVNARDDGTYEVTQAGRVELAN